MENQEENKIPTFIDQAFAIIEETYSQEGAKDQHGMTIADHKLLCRVLNAHETYIDENVIKKFVSAIAEHYDPIMRGISSLSLGMEQIGKDIVTIKERLSMTEDKVSAEEIELERIKIWQKQTDEWKNRKKLKIERMEIELSMLQPEYIKQIGENVRKDANDITLVKPILTKIVNMFKWWKIAIYILIVAILAALMVLTLHKNGVLGQLKNGKQSYKEWTQELKTQQAKGYSTITRGAKLTKNYTDAQKDSAINVNQHNIQMMIDKRDEEYKKLSETWKSKK
jgi:hypothetical protein